MADGVGQANLRDTQIFSWQDEAGLALQRAGLGSIELTAGASGSVDTITIDAGVDLLGGVPIAFDTSLAVTALRVAEALNVLNLDPRFWYFADLAFIRCVQKNPAVGVFVVASTATTITTSDTDIDDGADAATRHSQASAAAVATGAIYKVSFDFSKHANSVGVPSFNKVGRLDLQLDFAWYWTMNFGPSLSKEVALATDKELSVGGINEHPLFIYNKSGSAAAPSYTLFGV